jgi:hypothetical protein
VADEPAVKPNPDAPMAVTTVMLAVIGGFAAIADGTVLALFSDRVDILPFLAFTTLVAGIACAAVILPRQVGHVLAVVLAAASIAGGGAAFYKHMTPVLPVTLLVAGSLMAFLAAKSWQGERAAWSFLISICAVMFVCLFFGAPKVRGTIGVGIWIALILPGLFAVATVALAVEYERYRSKLLA